MDDLVNYIIEETKGFLSENEVNEFISQIENYASDYKFTKLSFANFERILKSLFDLKQFVSDSLKFPHYTEIIALIAHHSNFLTSIIIRYPSLIYVATDITKLKNPFAEKELEGELSLGLKRRKTFESKLKYLRKQKHKYILLIAVADYLDLISLEKAITKLSSLMRLLIKFTFEISLDEIKRRKEIKTLKINYVIASLGKLGGNELNYSSDVDLLFFFDRNKKIRGTDYDTFEILSDAIKLFAEASSRQTQDGFLFRPDFRLRPDGKYSPLAKTYTDYIHYYETRAENWERQMLLKLSFIGGNKKVYSKFQDLLLPFVFPSSIPEGIFESVRKMKSEIENSAEGKYNIKKIAGGIRDIEFSVQLLQILNGKKIPELRTPNTLDAIEILKQHNLLTNKEADELKSNYVYYRKIEHYLQLVDDTQTHEIPQSGKVLAKLTNYFGFNNPSEFLNDLNKRRKIVREIFNSIANVSDTNKGKENLDFFNDLKKAKRNLDLLLKGKGLSGVRNYDKITLERAEKLKPLLIEKLKSTPFPDIALENIAKIVSSVKIPSILLKEMNDKKFLELFINLSLFSERFVSLVLESPNFIDDLISRAFLLYNYKRISNTRKLIFFVVCKIVSKTINPNEAGEIIADFATEKIKEIAKEFFDDEIFIASLGSLSTRTMNYRSDIDLIIIAKNSANQTSLNSKAEKFIEKLKNSLSPFSIDFQLRPEGKSSQLIWGIDAVQKYFGNRISAWELLAFSKIRFVYGNKNTFEKFFEIYLQKIKGINRKQFLTELKSIYGKLLQHKNKFTQTFNLKYSHGGITTIDFIRLPQLIFEHTEILINVILNNSETPINTAFDKLRMDYLTLIIALQTLFVSSEYSLPQKEEEKHRFELFLRHLNSFEIYSKLNQSKNLVVKEFEKFYG